jgi:uncharacterized protein
MSAADADGGREVRIYRSASKRDMYLYVDAVEDLSRVPEALLQRFGRPQKSMDLLLTPQRRLALAEAAVVLASIAESGFYLQLPPGAYQPL